MSVNYQNLYAQQIQNQRATSAAQAAYQMALASNLPEQMALARAQFAWQQELDKAAQTGMWNGQYNMPTEQYFAGAFGTWMPNGPQAGQQTLQGQQQQFQQGYDISSLYGQYYAPGTNPNQGQQTLQAQNQAEQLGLSQAGLTGYYLAPGQTGQGQQTLAGQQQQFSQGLQTQQEQRAAQAQGQEQAIGYLNLLSNLRGPADWAKYQQVLGSTPNGLRDLTAAAMGQYVPGGGATTGMQPQAASLQSLMGDVSGVAYNGQGGGQLNMPNVYTGGQSSYGYQPNPTQMMPQQGGGSSWGTGINYGDQNGAAGAAMGGAGAAPGSSANNGLGQMPLPNQISAQSWKNFTPSQQQMYLGAYENAGWDKNDVTALMNQSLPRYASNAASAGTWRM